LSPREKKLAAFALLFAGIACVWNFALMPVIDGFVDRAETRAALRAEYIRNDRILAGSGGWRMGAKRQSESEAQFAVVAPTRSVGSERIVHRLAQSVRAVGGTILESQDVKAGVPPDWISVRSDMRLTLGQLNTVLSNLQSEKPYVVVNYISISIAGGPQSGQPDSLVVRMDISAPFRVENSSVGGASANRA
jgi:hypothetical protein